MKRLFLFLLGGCLLRMPVLGWGADINALMAALGQDPNTVNAGAVNQLVEAGVEAVPALCQGVRSPIFSVAAGSKHALKRMVDEKQLNPSILTCIQTVAPSPYAPSLNAEQIKMVMLPLAATIRSSTAPMTTMDNNLVLAGSAGSAYLVPLLQDPNPWARWNAIEALQRLEKAGAITPSWEKMIRDILDERETIESHPRVRAKIAEGFHR